MDPGIVLTIPEESALEPNVPYRQVVDTLLFVAMVSRPGIVFAVGQLSRYLSRFGQSHWADVKHVMRYLLGTVNYSLVYSGRHDSVQVTGYRLMQILLGVSSHVALRQNLVF